jgi:hypothetical protein
MLQVSNIRRLMKAVRDISAAPCQRRCTFLLDFEVLDGPFWCGTQPLQTQSFPLKFQPLVLSCAHSWEAYDYQLDAYEMHWTGSQVE